MGKVARNDILNLTVAERIDLIGDLWDSLADTPEAITLTDAQKAELDRRLDAYHKDPTAGAPWPTVRDRIAKNLPPKPETQKPRKQGRRNRGKTAGCQG